MKTTKRIIMMLLMLVMLVSLATAAFAATSTNMQYGGSTGGGSKYHTYTATASGTAKISFTMGKGRLSGYDPDLGRIGYNDCYGSYEVKIYDVTAGKWTVSSEDIYCVGSKSISFTAVKGHQYKITVYFWKASTTMKSYCTYNKGTARSEWWGITKGDLWQCRDICWEKLPTITMAPANNLK